MEKAFSSNLIEILDEQMALEFTGRVNILQKTTGQLLGIVIFNEGKIIFAKYGKVLGLKGLGGLLMEDITGASFKFIVEPEIVDGIIPNIGEKLDNLPLRFNNLIKLTLNAQKLKPPPSLKLAINKDFFYAGEDLVPDEFDVLCAISDFNRVGDIYKEAGLYSYQITNALVSLREKKAIYVVSN